MTALTWIGLALAALVSLYLLFALLAPERLS